MATWQYDFSLLPASKVSEICGNTPEILSSEVFEDTAWWDSAQPPADYDLMIGSFLSKYEAWEDSFKLWGDEKGDRIDVSLDPNGQVERIKVRVDVSKLNIPFLEKTIEFANTCKCLLLIPRMKIIQPEIDTVLAEIRKSSAWHFVSDPIDFLKSLKKSSL